MSNHTAGRLQVSISADKAVCLVEDLDGNSVCRCNAPFPFDTSWDERDANARRLVACWNWCEGFSTEFMERRVNPFSNTLLDVESDRDELIAQLRHLANNVTAYFDPGYDNRHYYRDEKKLLEMADASRLLLAKHAPKVTA
jgi:hypothetical protein